MTRVLIVANDNAIFRLFGADADAPGGFSATIADTVAEALTQAVSAASGFDAIILHSPFPSSLHEAERLCAMLRGAGLRLPVIILAEDATEQDVVRSLESGAADVVAAPFRPAELRARVRAQIRSHANNTEMALRIGGLVFHPGARSLEDSAGRQRARLTWKEAEVLKYLHRAAGSPVSRQVLLRDVWGYRHDADSYTVETHIYRLRRKIESDPSNPRLLLNEAGGYRLLGDLPAEQPTAKPRFQPQTYSLSA